jgi:hypothetical protein
MQKFMTPYRNFSESGRNFIDTVTESVARRKENIVMRSRQILHASTTNGYKTQNKGAANIVRY